jgi:tetratricopeptide (TPR) repeat protein
MRWPLDTVFQRLTTYSAIVALLLLASPLWASQDDPRLDGLFKRLHEISEPHEAAEIQDRIWEIWIESGDSNVDTIMSAGRRAMAGGDYQKALAAFDSVVDQLPDFAEGWNKRATVYYLMGNFVASVRDIERTVALEPRHFGAFSGLGLIYLAIGDEAAALRAFEATLKINPHLPGTQTQIERLKARQKDKAI